MSRDNVAWVTSKPRLTSRRRNSSWLPIGAPATSSLIAVCRSCFIMSSRLFFSFLHQSQSEAQGRALGVHKNTFTCINIQSPLVNEWMPFLIKKSLTSRCPTWCKRNFHLQLLVMETGIIVTYGFLCLKYAG